MNTLPSAPGLERATRLWALMQRIERCRYRAELAQAKARCGSQAFRAEMAEITSEWLDLAREIELVEGVSPMLPLGMARPSPMDGMSD